MARANVPALEQEARQLRSMEGRMPLDQISKQLHVRTAAVAAWVKDIDQAYEAAVRDQARTDYQTGDLIDTIARRYQLDLKRATAMVRDLFDAELFRLRQCIEQDPGVSVALLREQFPRWTVRALYHYVHKLLPLTESDFYTPPGSDEEYANVAGIATRFDVVVETAQAAVCKSQKIRYLKVLKKGKKKPFFYYSVADLMDEYPRFGRYHHIRASLERNPNNVLGWLPADLCLSSWVVLLTFLLFRRQHFRRPTSSELFAAIDRSYRYTQKTIENALDELKRLGYLVGHKSELFATPRCPIEFIASEPESLPGYHQKVQAYFDFVVSGARIVVVEPPPAPSDEELVSPLKRRWMRYSEMTRQERDESL